MYKIGDTVKVKTYDNMVNEYGCSALGEIYFGRCNFINDMKEFCGKTVTIKEILSNESYGIEEDNDNFEWADKMFEN